MQQSNLVKQGFIAIAIGFYTGLCVALGAVAVQNIYEPMVNQCGEVQVGVNN